MSTPQEYWDACLIRTWRQSGSVLDAMIMFKSITKVNLEDVEPKLLRIPRVGFPWKIGIRIFMASHLSKISNRLWDQSPEKDVALLQKPRELDPQHLAAVVEAGLEIRVQPLLFRDLRLADRLHLRLPLRST